MPYLSGNMLKVHYSGSGMARMLRIIFHFCRFDSSVNRLNEFGCLVPQG